MLRALAAGLVLSAGSALLAPLPAAAGGDGAFFRQVAGHWTGPGEIIAGKYKGTKFVCTFDGLPHEGDTGVALDGACRVGVFSQKMRADVKRSGSTYKGAFQDGAAGEGLDIVSGKVGADHMVVGLDRKKLKGAMIARLQGADTMAITVSVRVEEDLVPVLGMSLKRAETPSRQSALGE